MSEIINQLQNIDGFTFEDARNTVAYIGMATLPVVAGVAAIDYFRNPTTKLDSLRGADPELLRESIDEAKPSAKKRFGRWGSYLLVGAGASIASITLLDPQVETEVTVPGVEFIAVKDKSFSMEETTDMIGGVTRSSAIADVIIQTGEQLPEDTLFGIVLFGEDYKVTTPLTSDREALALGLNDLAIDPNGGSLSEAVVFANDVLNGSANPGSDTMIILSDGTIDNSADAVESIQVVLDDEKNVIMVVPGTVDGAYTRSSYDSQPISSGISTAAFEPLTDNQNFTLLATNDAAEIQELLNSQIDTETTVTQQEPVKLFNYAGFSMMAAGFALAMRRNWKRK